MKRIKIALILLLVLTVVAVILYFKQTNSTLKKELRDFAVTDTSGISKIFLADKNNNTITLERKDGYWAVNKNFAARKDLVDVLLKTICRLNVKAPVPKSTHNTIVKALATASVKVEIYSGSEKLKTYYVGGSTPDNLGTYMLLEGSSVPFVMDIPGFFGYLTTRYNTDLYEWRDRSVFRCPYPELVMVEVQIPAAPSQSFRVKKQPDNTLILETLSDNRRITDFDTLSVREFLGAFKLLNFDKFITEIPSKRRDSIVHSRPITIISVKSKDGTVNTAKFFNKPNFSRAQNKDGAVFPYDPDRMYAFINQDKDMVVAQYFVFDPVIRELNYFLEKRKR